MILTFFMLNFYNQSNGNGDNFVSGNGKNGKVKSSDINKYTDPTGEFGAKEFKRAVWYVKNKVLLHKIFISCLVGICAIFWLFSLWQWGDYLIFGIASDERLYNELAMPVDYTVIHSKYSPQPIQILGTDIFASGANKYDIVSELANPNEGFLVNFDYYFVVGAEKTKAQKGFLLPGENRPAAFRGFLSYPPQAGLVIENLVWERISSHSVPKVKIWQDARLNFSASDFSFTKSFGTDGAAADIIKFKLTNNSAYGYKEPDFYVGLFQNGSMVGLLSLHLSDFKSLETRDIDTRNYASGLSATDIKIFPLINIYDESVYMEPPK